jgi:hypothetical protein
MPPLRSAAARTLDVEARGLPVDAAPDLRTADQRERDDVAALTARLERLEAAVIRHADVLQALLLRQDDGE